VRHETVDGLRDRQELAGLPADEAAVVRYGQEFFRTHHVSRGVIELSLIMGNYSLLALLINAFDTDLPPQRTEPLLPV
jgi:hypothetical protein